MKLDELQRLFSSVLMDDAAPGALAAVVLADERADADERVDVYATMYLVRLCEVLGEVYPRCRALLGEERFEELAAAYVREKPSRHPSLRGYGDELASWLTTRDVPAGTASLAALEWARYDLFDAADEPLLTREALASRPPEAMATLGLRTIAASRVLHLGHAVDPLYRALAAGAALPEITAAPTSFLVWRQPKQVLHRVLTAREDEVLRAVERGIPLGVLCEQLGGDDVQAAAAEVFALVGRWLADGLLVFL